mmetsp:Transcript_10581/g.29129  ORF Transcript_10581/g.29129 Transcript_10581/m.29129 type:complete len:579 (+) Transcript_10581:741-2477(+)
MHGDGQHPAEHVGQAVPELVQKRLKEVARLGNGDDAGSPGVVDAVVEVINAARVDNLFARNVRAGHAADAGVEFGHGPVVLGPAKEPHVRVRELGVVDADRAPVRPDEGAAANVLVGERLAKPVRGRRDGPPEQQPQLRDERLPKDPALLLELFRLKVIQLPLRLLELLAGAPELALEHRDNRRDVLQVPALEEVLEESPELADADAGALGALKPPAEAGLELSDVEGLALGDRLPEVLIGPEDGVPRVADPARGHGREEGRASKHRGLEQPGRRPQEHLDVLGPRKLRDARVELGGDDHRPAQGRVDRHDEAPRRGVGPVVRVLQAEDDVLLLLHLGADHGLNLAGAVLQPRVALARGRGDEPWRVDDGQIGTVLVLDAHDDLLGPELALEVEARVLALDVVLELLERHVLLAKLLGEQVALRLDAARVVLHVQCDGAPGLGAPAHVVELEAHQGLDQGRLSVRLVADDEDRRRVERLLEVLRQRVQVVVGLVQALVAGAEGALRPPGACLDQGRAVDPSQPRRPPGDIFAFVSGIVRDRGAQRVSLRGGNGIVSTGKRPRILDARRVRREPPLGHL